MRFEDRWPSLWLACSIRSNLFLYSQWVAKKYGPLEKLYILFFQSNFYLVLYVLFAQSHSCTVCVPKAIYIQSMRFKVSLPSLSHIWFISSKRFQQIQEVRIGWLSRIPIYSISSKAFYPVNEVRICMVLAKTCMIYTFLKQFKEGYSWLGLTCSICSNPISSSPWVPKKDNPR